MIILPGHYWTISWNPVGGCWDPFGCTLASAACFNCYSARDAATFAAKNPLCIGTTYQVERYLFNDTLTVLPPGDPGWSEPLRYRGDPNSLLGLGQPSIVFVCITCELFHPRRPLAVIDQVVSTMALSRHVGLFLAKNAQRQAEFFAARRVAPRLWVGFSAERQQEFVERWSHMRPLAAAGWFTFASPAPLIKPIRLPDDFLGLVRWVIVGGEEGPSALIHDMHPAWARSLRDQCHAAGVPFFLKRMCGEAPIPPDLYIRQFPTLRG
jgi:protein gp37